MRGEHGELAVVVYAEQDGDWRPTQVFTRRWIRFADGSEGWTYDLFDGDWCRRDETLHLYNSGGGPPYVGRGATHGIHWRIWLAPGESVRDGGVTVAALLAAAAGAVARRSVDHGWAPA